MFDDDGPPPSPPEIDYGEQFSPSARTFRRGDEVELGEDLANRLGPRNTVIYAEGRIWVADHAGCWVDRHDDDLHALAAEYAGRLKWVAKPSGPVKAAIDLRAKNLHGIVEVAKILRNAPDHFAAAPFGAAFADCFCRVEGDTIAIEPLATHHRVKAIHRAPYALDLFAEPPAVTFATMRQTWAGFSDVEDRIEYFFQWLGAALLGIAHRYKASPLLVGEKDCGKSKIIDIADAVFPPTSCRAIPLHDFAGEYYRAALSTARLNRVNELPARELLDGEAAKAILSGETVSCRHPAGRPFDWVPRLACIFACNELPTSRDKALMGRFVVLDCPNVVAQADQNKRLGEQIHAEAPQIAAAAINAAARMLRNGAIAKPPTAESTQRDWQTDGDPVARWISEETVVSTETTSLADLYSRYRQWASAHGVFASGDVKFARQLRRNGVGQTRINNQHLWLLTISPARAAAAKRWGRPEGACHD